MDGTYEKDEELKLEIMNAITEQLKIGNSKRIIIQDIEQFVAKLGGNEMPIMENLKIDYDRVTSFHQMKNCQI